MKNSTVFSRALAGAALFMIGAESAMAHPGHGSSGFESGAVHPWLGLDHLLAMIAVGLWAFQLGGRAIWMVPLSFVSVMFAGGFLGIGHGTFSGMEQVILASVFVVGLLIAFAVRMPIWTAVALTGAFAFFHGFAHGTEMPGGSSALIYSLGFAVSTICLHLFGIGIGTGIGRVRRLVWVRALGGAIAASAAVLCFA